jgi:hypothetical protein
MRRLLAFVAVIILSGCGAGAPTAQSSPTPSHLVPKAGVCLATVAHSNVEAGYKPVDCATEHYAWTAHVGTLTGVAAEAQLPPTYDMQLSSDAETAAIDECVDGVTASFGKPWFDYAVNLHFFFPTVEAWEDGARWIRCDITFPEWFAEDAPALPMTGPVDAAMLSQRELGCLNLDRTAIRLTLVSCETPHTNEYVGFVRSAKQSDPSVCLDLSGKYMGLPPEQRRGGSSMVETWGGGRCFFVLLGSNPMTGSIKGSLGAGIPGIR